MAALEAIKTHRHPRAGLPERRRRRLAPRVVTGMMSTYAAMLDPVRPYT
jgi:hypothetical protein